MKVVCPFLTLSPATKLTLPRDAEFVDTSGSDFAYFELYRRLWQARETVVIVEQDIVPWPGALPRIHDCDQPLCFYPVPLFLREGAFMFSWGPVVKYSAGLMERFPEAIEQLPVKHWRDLVETVLVSLAAKVTPHEHNPPVSHIKDLEEWDPYCERMRTGQPREKHSL